MNDTRPGRKALLIAATLAVLVAGLAIATSRTRGRGSVPDQAAARFMGVPSPGAKFMGTIDPMHSREHVETNSDTDRVLVPAGEEVQGEESEEGGVRPADPYAKVEQPAPATSIGVESATLDSVYYHLGGPVGSQTPPDGGLAIGPNDQVSVTNQAIAFTDRNGHRLTTQGLDDFFNAVKPAPAGRFVDPYVLWDPSPSPAGGRYWLVVQNNDHKTHANMLIAYSTTAHATDPWKWYATDLAVYGGTTHQQFCDYDKLGIDAKAVYLTCNMLADKNSTDVNTAELRILTKSELLSSTPKTTSYSFVNFKDLGTNRQSRWLMPALKSGTEVGDGELIVSSDGAGAGGNGFSVYRVVHPEYCCDTGASVPTLQSFHVPVTKSFAPAPNMHQKGTSTLLTGITLKVATPVWNRNSLSFAMTVACGWASKPNTSCIRFFQFQTNDFPNSMTIDNDWSYGFSNADLYIPGLMARPDGWKTMVFARSSTSEYPSAWFIAIQPAEVCMACISGSPILLKAGVTPYTQLDTSGRVRWGDYFTAAPDPDGKHIWIEGERTIEPTDFETWVGRTTPH